MFKKYGLVIIFLITISSIGAVNLSSSTQTNDSVNDHTCACVVDFEWLGPFSKSVYIDSHNHYRVYEASGCDLVGGFELQEGQSFLFIHTKEWIIINPFIPFVMVPDIYQYHIHGVNLHYDHKIVVKSYFMGGSELFLDDRKIPAGVEVYL
ncbi:MAG: hypothetical protein LBD03_01050 [Methanobrevibacter sp.]|jgi:hypothetical protein|nr:hypothetical protein [Candidatus Methanovirga procula]